MPRLRRYARDRPEVAEPQFLDGIAHHAHLDGIRRNARMSATDPAGLERTQDANGSDPVVVPWSGALPRAVLLALAESIYRQHPTALPRL